MHNKGKMVKGLLGIIMLSAVLGTNVYASDNEEYVSFDVHGLECYVPAGWEIFINDDGTVGKGINNINDKYVSYLGTSLDENGSFDIPLDLYENAKDVLFMGIRGEIDFINWGNDTTIQQMLHLYRYR